MATRDPGTYSYVLWPWFSSEIHPSISLEVLQTKPSSIENISFSTACRCCFSFQTPEFFLYSWEESEDWPRKTQFKLPLLQVPLINTFGRAAPLPHMHAARAEIAAMPSRSSQHLSAEAHRAHNESAPSELPGSALSRALTAAWFVLWDKHPSHKEIQWQALNSCREEIYYLSVYFYTLLSQKAVF